MGTKSISLVIALAASAMAFIAGGCTETTHSIFLERGGLMHVQAEARPSEGDWRLETDMEGFYGNGYYTWRGEDHFKTPGSGEIVYQLLIRSPGRYNLRIHNRHDFEDATEQNDVWLKMDDGPWIKTYSPVRGRWTWRTMHEYAHDDKKPAAYELAQGLHTFRVSGRSTGFSIDSFCFYQDQAAPVEITGEGKKPAEGSDVQDSAQP